LTQDTFILEAHFQPIRKVDAISETFGIAVAQQQKAKSFELRAALSLAKFYQSTNRAADAHVVLAPALKAFRRLRNTRRRRGVPE
jgi:hypothetical protein